MTPPPPRGVAASELAGGTLQADGGMRSGHQDAGEATLRTAGRMSARTLARLAWASGTFAVLVVAATLLLIVLARGAQLPPGFRTAGVVETLQFLGPAIVGAVLAARRPHNPIGWLLLGLGLCFALYPVLEAVRGGRAGVDTEVASYAFTRASVACAEVSNRRVTVTGLLR